MEGLVLKVSSYLSMNCIDYNGTEKATLRIFISFLISVSPPIYFHSVVSRENLFVRCFSVLPHLPKAFLMANGWAGEDMAGLLRPETERASQVGEKGDTEGEVEE